MIRLYTTLVEKLIRKVSQTPFQEAMLRMAADAFTWFVMMFAVWGIVELVRLLISLFSR